jgi:hypothetical protein
MYWFMSDSRVGWLILFLLLALITFGGWLAASSAFRLRARERLFSGLGIGLVLFIFFSNVFGQLFSPEISFWLAAGSVAMLGVVFWYSTQDRKIYLMDQNQWALLALFVLLAIAITLIGRGIGIFDDRKNLSIISTMAAGDIPPHFYMNPDYLFNYHYGFQLFGAGLMRVARLYPWSAFDLSKGIVAALAITLAFLWGWRATHSKIWAAATAMLVSFASGTRWMMNLFPQSVLRSASEQVELWGASGSTVTSLFEGLSQTWTVDGGPPLALPFSYVNGILQPFVLKLHKGPISLSLVILFLVLLLIGRNRSWKGTLILGMIFATWGLTAEAEFLLFGFGFAMVFAWYTAREGIRKALQSPSISSTMAALLAGVVVSVFQGGTITELAKGLVGFRAAGDLGGGTGLGGFQFRWPPAVVSAHLGELRITEPYELLVGLFEIGPAILAGFLVLFYIHRWLNHGRIAESSLALGSFVAFLLPLFLKYDVDRDITRMTAFALMGWILLAVPALCILIRRYKSDWLRIITFSWMGSLIFGGLVVAGSLITSMPRAIFSYHVADLDVHMTQQVWDQLPEDALVISSHAWLVVPVTGRPTRTFRDNTTPLDSWLDHVAFSNVDDLVQDGYTFAYVDEIWWANMAPEVKESFSRDCVQLVAQVEDTSKTHFRKMFDLSGCRQ